MTWHDTSTLRRALVACLALTPMLALLPAVHAQDAGSAAAPAEDIGGQDAAESATGDATGGDPEPTIWGYLVDKYDADHDGRVSRAEYERTDETFDRLDRDDDGALSEADFVDASGRARGGMRAGMMAPIVLMHAFDTEAGEGMGRDELQASFATYDSDDDGRVSRREYVDGLLVHTGGDQGMLRGMRFDRFAALLEMADADDDLHLGLEETLAWFDERDSDGDGQWVLGGRGRGIGRGAGREGGDRERGPGDSARDDDTSDDVDTSPSAEGRIAPDFSLEPPAGGDPVRLSSFKGEKPVALIFGSYT